MSTGYIKDGAYIETAGLGYGGGWCGMPDWGHAQKVTFDGSWQYTAPDDGYIIGRAQANDNSTAQLYIDNIIVSVTRYINGSYVTYANVQVPINKGDVLSVQGGTLQDYALAFVPFKAASAGEGLSAAAVKQLRRLNYMEYVPSVDLPSNSCGVTGGAGYRRVGNVVKLYVTIASATRAFGVYEVLCNLSDIGAPSTKWSETAAADYNGPTTGGDYGDVNLINLTADGTIRITVRKAFAAGNDKMQYNITYFTDDPIPGEEA